MEIKHTLEQPMSQRKKSKDKFKKTMKENKNKNTVYQNLWDIAKTVQRGKFAVINAYIRKNGIKETAYFTLHLTRKKEQSQRQIKKIRIEVNEVETRKKIDQ